MFLSSEIFCLSLDGGSLSQSCLNPRRRRSFDLYLISHREEDIICVRHTYTFLLRIFRLVEEARNFLESLQYNSDFSLEWTEAKPRGKSPMRLFFGAREVNSIDHRCRSRVGLHNALRRWDLLVTLYGTECGEIV